MPQGSQATPPNVFADSWHYYVVYSGFLRKKTYESRVFGALKKPCYMKNENLVEIH